MKYTKFLCHRIPERSFHYKKHQFPVCARCTGFYTGLIIFLIYNYFYPVNYTLNLVIISVLLLIPTGIDGLTQLMNLRESNNNMRFITGLIGGLDLIILMIMLVKIFFKLVGAYL